MAINAMRAFNWNFYPGLPSLHEQPAQHEIILSHI